MNRNLCYRLAILFCVVFLLDASIIFSRTINGKLILSGSWRGKSGEYVAGEILAKLKPGVSTSQI